MHLDLQWCTADHVSERPFARHLDTNTGSRSGSTSIAEASIMTRFFAFTMAAFIILTAGLTHAQPDKDVLLNVKGKLTKDDNKDAQRNGPMQVHKVALKAGKKYTID